MIRRTSIQIMSDTWEDLNSIRRIGESMDDIVKRLIEDEIKYLKITEPDATRLVEAY